MERFYPLLHNILGNPVMSCNFLINLSIIVVVSTFSMRTYIPNKIKYQKRRTPILPVVLYCLTKRRHTIKTLVQISLIHKFILIIENKQSVHKSDLGSTQCYLVHAKINKSTKYFFLVLLSSKTSTTLHSGRRRSYHRELSQHGR